MNMAQKVTLPAGTKGKLFWAPWRRILVFVIFLLQGCPLILGGLVLTDRASEAFPSGVAKAKQDVAWHQQRKREDQAKLDKNKEAQAKLDRVPRNPIQYPFGTPAEVTLQRERTAIEGDMMWMDILTSQTQESQKSARDHLANLHWYLMMIVLGLGLWAIGYYISFVVLPRQRKQFVLVEVEVPQPTETRAPDQGIDAAATAKALDDLNKGH
jgi:hypothetical protein